MTGPNGDYLAQLRDTIACAVRDGMAQLVALGPERSVHAARSKGHVLALGRFAVDLSDTTDRFIGGAGELLVVESGGHPSVTLVFELEEGERRAIALPGTSFQFPFKRVRVIPPSTPALTGTMTLWIGPRESFVPRVTLGTLRQGLLGDPFVVSEPSPLDGAAIAGNVVSTLVGVAGFEYELAGVAVELSTDATVANRLVRVDLYHDDGTTISQTCRSDVVAASSFGHFTLGPGGSVGLNLESAHLDQSGHAVQLVVFPTGQANVNLVKVTIVAGVAGDAYKVRAVYRRRALIDE